MNITIKMAAAVLLFMVFAAIAGDLSADRPLDKAFKKDVNSKTWEVYYSTTKHMAYGDKFRVQGNGSKFSFKPYYKLRTKWAHKDDANYAVELTDHGTYFCGMAELKTTAHTEEPSGHHPWHMFVIDITDSEDLKIRWSGADFEEELTEQVRIDACEEANALTPHHGGMAHAEPN